MHPQDSQPSTTPPLSEESLFVMRNGSDLPLLIRTLQGQRQDRVPLWLLRQAGRYLPEYRAVRARRRGFMDMAFHVESATEVTMQPIDRFDLDAAILFSDILVLPVALGQEVWFEEGEGPRLGPLDAVDLGAEVDPAVVRDRLGPVLETVGAIRKRLSADKALIGFAGAPWTVASYMVAARGTKDQAPARDLALKDPDRFGRLIDRLVEGTIAYLSAQAAAGAQALMLFDSWSGALSAGEFDRWVLSPTQRILTALKAERPDVPLIGFPRGAGTRLTAYAKTGCDAVHIDESVPPAYAAAQLQPQLCVQGNLDPRLMAVGGPRLDEEVQAILSGLSGGAHVFNLGHGMTPDCDPALVTRLVDRVRSFEGASAHV